MNLQTTYCGLTLPHPLMPGASPLVDDLDVVRRLEDAGAAAIVMHSLFEEQVEREWLRKAHLDAQTESFAEALTFLPRADEFALGPDRYVEQLRRVKEAVRVPVIGSLNGTTPSGWLHYAGLLEQAGADALELNVYYLATDASETSAAVEARTLDILRTVKASVTIPVAVKLSPFFSALAHFAAELDALGADALVIFNRFYQPDIDVEALETVPTLHLSESFEILPRLRWLAILAGRVRASLAITGGVHTPVDAVKAVMAGADAVQMVSALLKHGPEHLAVVRTGLVAWMEEHEYESLAQMRGSMSHARCPDPGAFERANYARVLQSWSATAR
jgi:dihydroorotate dehydrogenase (fumarate)